MSDTRSEPPDRYTRRFWEHLADGRLSVHGCGECDRRFFPPAPVCPHCGSRDVDWVDTDGRGRLYSFTRQHTTPPGFDAPLVVGLVELDAGPRLLAPIAADYDSLAIGDAVRIVPAEYTHDYDRRGFAEYPFFEAVPE